MENQITLFKTQAAGPPLASCHCVKITFVPRWADIVINIVVRWLNMLVKRYRPMSKITWGQHRRKCWADIMSDELPKLGKRCHAMI